MRGGHRDPTGGWEWTLGPAVGGLALFPAPTHMQIPTNSGGGCSSAFEHMLVLGLAFRASLLEDIICVSVHLFVHVLGVF